VKIHGGPSAYLRACASPDDIAHLQTPNSHNLSQFSSSSKCKNNDTDYCRKSPKAISRQQQGFASSLSNPTPSLDLIEVKETTKHLQSKLQVARRTIHPRSSRLARTLPALASYPSSRKRGAKSRPKDGEGGRCTSICGALRTPIANSALQNLILFETQSQIWLFAFCCREFELAGTPGNVSLWVNDLL